MKIINKNNYKLMYGIEFIEPQEVKDIKDEKILNLLLNHTGVEKYIDKEEAKKLEEENEQLKEKLKASKLENARNRAKELGIEFDENTTLAKLQIAIKKAETKNEADRINELYEGKSVNNETGN